MWIDYQKPEAKLYDLYVNGQKIDDWVRGDDATGEYEIFVRETPWRGGGKIPDTDNPTGFQTLKQTGKVEFKRNDLPDPKQSEKATIAEVSPDWGNPFDPWAGYNPSSLPLQVQWDQLSPGVQKVLSSLASRPSFGSWLQNRAQYMAQLQRSVTFASEDGKTWGYWNGERTILGVRFTGTRVTGGFLELELEMPRWDRLRTEGQELVPETVSASVPIYSPGVTWTHTWKGGQLHRKITLTSFCEHYKERGLELFQHLHSLEIRLRQEVGLPV